MSDRARSSHRFPVRVYYEDTDAAGVVYYANYLKFAERARTEMMRAAGADHAGLAAERGVAIAVRRCEIDYLRPARLDDLLEVETRILEIGGAAVDGEQVVSRDGVELVRLRVRLACVDGAGRATRLPAPLRAALARYCQLQERV